MVGAVRLALAGADFDIMGEAGLQCQFFFEHPEVFRTRELGTHPHGRMQGTSNLIVLLQSRAAAQNLRQPKLPDGALHMADLPLSGGRRADPLGGFPANTTDHVGMGQGLRGSLGGFRTHLRGNGLGNARMQRGGATGNDQGIFTLIASHRPVASGGAGERRSKGRSHYSGFDSEGLVFNRSKERRTGISRQTGCWLLAGWLDGWISTSFRPLAEKSRGRAPKEAGEGKEKKKTEMTQKNKKRKGKKS